MPTRAAVVALSLLASLLAASGRARAYVRYRTAAGVPWQWRGTSCLPIVAYPRDLRDMTADEVGAAALAAAGAWSAGQNPCSYLTLTVDLSTEPGPLALPRDQATIVFRETRWCRLLTDGTCSTKPEDAAVYQDSVLMLTSTRPTDNTSGTMAVSSIEVNAVDHAWADLALHPELQSGATFDLQNGLTHELGHFVGLNHNCVSEVTVPPVLDDRDEAAPACALAPAEIREATMFPTAFAGDLDKRTLGADDTNALCDIYPAANDPKVCAPPWLREPPSGCGCSTAPAAAPSALAAVLGALVLVTRRGGRRRRCVASAVVLRP